ncbi:Trp biosynthesis-associated membrane protein [Brevibacterium luteolum]|uniref:Trp biosynthesis protein n=1 Tax=Brevibacterium luteolum TaxID=199591 RepID=A0A2N6PKV0_9MICO|nr:Trp biosynthesis-associated membrane protein [Brevibacterium luteolum]PMB99322.1 hypothetical protein CJ198_01975 [Brevibacterium luteolum]
MTRSRAVIALLGAAAVLWIVGSQPWFQPAETAELAGVSAGSVAAPENSPVLLACAGIVAVSGLLLTMLKRIGRWIVSACAALAGLGFAGVALSASLSSAQTTNLPAIGIIAGLLAAAVAVWVLLRSGSWQTTARFEADTSEAEAEDEHGDLDPTRTWDAISRGEDPS